VEEAARKLIQRHCHVAEGRNLARQPTVAQHHTCHSKQLGQISMTPVTSRVTTLYITININ